MPNEGWRIGMAVVTPIHEIDGGCVIQAGMPEATPERIRGIAWLRPDFADDEGVMRGAVQAFLVELADRRILVDTGLGNGKPRPGLPAWSELDTDFLDQLAACGVQPADVDVVVCTHMHFDHVGWNTVAADAAWVPTFPNARHILTQDEFDFWRGMPSQANADDRTAFVDSVLPVVEAGLADLVPSTHEVCAGMRLVPTPGHTPGHVSVLVESAGQQALISGDALHHPCQLAHPEWGVLADVDPEMAGRSRRALLERCVESGALLIGSHFAAPTAVAVYRDGDRFRVG